MIASPLETRVTNRKQELISEIVELKLGSRLDAVETIDRLKARLSELATIVNEGVVDDWSNIGARTRRKLDAWVAR
jgi:hypothetical protein